MIRGCSICCIPSWTASLAFPELLGKSALPRLKSLTSGEPFFGDFPTLAAFDSRMPPLMLFWWAGSERQLVVAVRGRHVMTLCARISVDKSRAKANRGPKHRVPRGHFPPTVSTQSQRGGWATLIMRLNGKARSPPFLQLAWLPPRDRNLFRRATGHLNRPAGCSLVIATAQARSLLHHPTEW